MEKIETTFFSISGYWKDNTEDIFTDYIVYAYDNSIDGEEFDDYPYSDDDIFYYGLGEHNIKQAIEDGKNGVDDALEFVITSYETL